MNIMGAARMFLSRLRTPPTYPLVRQFHDIAEQISISGSRIAKTAKAQGDDRLGALLRDMRGAKQKTAKKRGNRR